MVDSWRATLFIARASRIAARRAASFVQLGGKDGVLSVVRVWREPMP